MRIKSYQEKKKKTRKGKSEALETERTRDSVGEGSSNSHYWCLGWDDLLLSGATLCTVGCSAPLTSTQETPGAPAPKLYPYKCLQMLPNVSRGKITLQLRLTAIAYCPFLLPPSILAKDTIYQIGFLCAYKKKKENTTNNSKNKPESCQQKYCRVNQRVLSEVAGLRTRPDLPKTLCLLS